MRVGRSTVNRYVARFHISFAGVSRVFRAVSRRFAAVSRVSRRVFREFRGCLAAVSRCLTRGPWADDMRIAAIHPLAKFVIGSKHFEILHELPPPHL